MYLIVNEENIDRDVMDIVYGSENEAAIIELSDNGYVELNKNSLVITLPYGNTKKKIERDTTDYPAIFDQARKLYKGTKRGNQTEFINFTKKHHDWKTEIHKLHAAIIQEIKWHNMKVSRNEFVPEYKNFQTWINQRCWENEYTDIAQDQIKVKPFTTYNDL
jgi:hypothetical protein